MTVRELGEYPLVHRICHRLQQTFGIDPRVLVGAGDDAAIVETNGVRMVLTIDAQLEGIHFRRQWMPPFDLGYKAIAVSLSDIAAMGAKPLAALLALSLSGDEPAEFVDALYDGAISLCQETATLLLGGDTTRSPDGVMVYSVVLGILDNSAWTRQGAQVGDALLLTGTVGDAAAGLWLLEYGEGTKNEGRGTAERTANSSPPLEAVRHCLQRFRRPTPRLAVPKTLLSSGLQVHAAIDISDGLIIDAERLATSSGVTVVLDLRRLPLSDDLRTVAQHAGKDPLEWALKGGEDYELLLAVSAPDAPKICEALRQANIPVCPVGEVTERRAEAVLGLLPDGTQRALSGGFQHFS